jgi:hypothetical protein
MTQLAIIAESANFKLSQARGGDPLVLVRKSDSEEHVFVGNGAVMARAEFEQMLNDYPEGADDEILTAFWNEVNK